MPGRRLGKKDKRLGAKHSNVRMLPKDVRFRHTAVSAGVSESCTERVGADSVGRDAEAEERGGDDEEGLVCGIGKECLAMVAVGCITAMVVSGIEGYIKSGPMYG
jgi:hypothetical protein